MLAEHSFYVPGIGSTLIDPLMLVASVDFSYVNKNRETVQVPSPRKKQSFFVLRRYYTIDVII